LIGSDAVFAADAEIGSDAVFAVDAEIGSDAVFAADFSMNIYIKKKFTIVLGLESRVVTLYMNCSQSVGYT
jgi:hypothetical protein